jgi:hypothetical protein
MVFPAVPNTLTEIIADISATYATLPPFHRQLCWFLFKWCCTASISVALHDETLMHQGLKEKDKSLVPQTQLNGVMQGLHRASL